MVARKMSRKPSPLISSHASPKPLLPIHWSIRPFRCYSRQWPPEMYFHPPARKLFADHILKRPIPGFPTEYYALACPHTWKRRYPSPHRHRSRRLPVHKWVKKGSLRALVALKEPSCFNQYESGAADVVCPLLIQVENCVPIKVCKESIARNRVPLSLQSGIFSRGSVLFRH